MRIKLLMFMSVMGLLCVSLTVDAAVSVDAEVKDEVLAADDVIQQKEDLQPAQQDSIGNITLDFKDADIRSVLKIISLKTGERHRHRGHHCCRVTHSRGAYSALLGCRRHRPNCGCHPTRGNRLAPSKPMPASARSTRWGEPRLSRLHFC